MDFSQAALESIWRASAFMAGALVAAGATIEPEPGAWLWATAGSFLAVSVGRDRSAGRMAVHLAIGTIIGVALASLLSWKFGTPRAPTAFLIGLFGVDLFGWFGRQVRDGTLAESVGKFISAIKGKR